MKPIRNILLTAFLATLVFSAVIYTSCNKNKCTNVKCLNKGLCDGGKCICPVGFEGPRCEIPSRDKFIFTYNGGELCDTLGLHEYPIYLLSIKFDTLEMTMKNLFNNPEDSAICTIQSTDSFSFQGSNNSTSYYGSGVMRHDSLRLNYHVTRDTFVYDCSYLGLSLR